MLPLNTLQRGGEGHGIFWAAVYIFHDYSAGRKDTAGTVISQSRRLAAILAADIAGYSALMGSDETRTVSDLKGHQAVVLPMVSEFGGRVIDTAGDGILAEFPSVLDAVQCAVAVQRRIVERNPQANPRRRVDLYRGPRW